MSAYNSGFVTGTNSIGGDALVPFVEVHEDPVQNIQGGIPGEHYHLTSTEHTGIQALVAYGDSVVQIYEPVVDTALGELMYDDLTGDVMLDFGGEYAS